VTQPRTEGRDAEQAAGLPALLVQAMALGLLAVIVAAPGLGNGYAFDDLPIVRDNPRVHSIAGPWSYLTESYWHWSHCCAAYRPLSIWLFSLEWATGGGAPWVFHTVNVALFAAIVVGVFQLARHMMGTRAAWVAAGLFAVHPVHVEAVANVVGQEELVLAGLTVSAVLAYVVARRRGMPTPGVRLGLAGLVTIAPLAKEQGFVLPLLLLAAELTLVRDPDSWGRRFRALAPTYALMFLGLVLAGAARTTVLGGLGAGVIAPSIEQLGFGGRLLVGLQSVPSWTRLLVWPSHLQANYSPPAYGLERGLGLRELGGVALLGGLALALLFTWRRQPPIAFGLLWSVLTLSPVSNVAFPTGLIIAERTLFLPSVGVILALAAFADAFWPPVTTLPRLLQSAAMVGVVPVLVAGGLYTAERQRVWKSNDVLFPQTVRDAPDSYAAHWVYANWLDEGGATTMALQIYREAVTLYQGDPKLYEDYGQVLRRTGSCREAAGQFVRALVLDPARTVARARLFECRMATGDYLGARDAVAHEVANGHQEYAGMLARADRAIAAGEDSASGPRPAAAVPPKLQRTAATSAVPVASSESRGAE
jgi:tetratricopeptide (TPR) repeat protein